MLDHSTTETTADQLTAYLERRGIDVQTQAHFGVEHIRPDGMNELVIAFPYHKDGEVNAYKFRTMDKRFRSTKDVTRGLFNGRILPGLPADATLYITEGEIDAMSLAQAGFMNAVSLPNGWGENQKSLDFLDEYRGDLARIKTVVVAGDNDRAGAGLPLAVLNYMREIKRGDGDIPDVRYCVWEEGCKDANDVLVKHGAQQLEYELQSAKLMHFPAGRVATFSQLTPRPPRKVLKTQTFADNAIAFELGGISCVTGYPGSGKSQFSIWAAHKIAMHENIRVGLFSLETHPYRVRNQLSVLVAGAKYDNASTEQRDKIVTTLEDRYRIFERDIMDDAPLNLENMLDHIRDMAIRHGCKLILIDPWNEIEHMRNAGESETDYTNYGLGRLRQLAASLEVHIAIVAHPKKPDTNSSLTAPSGYDVSGSAAWFNKVDMGVSVFWNGKHAEEPKMYVKNWKSRDMEFTGVDKNTVEHMHFDMRTQEYTSSTFGNE